MTDSPLQPLINQLLNAQAEVIAECGKWPAVRSQIRERLRATIAGTKPSLQVEDEEQTGAIVLRWPGRVTASRKFADCDALLTFALNERNGEVIVRYFAPSLIPFGSIGTAGSGASAGELKMDEFTDVVIDRAATEFLQLVLEDHWAAPQKPVVAQAGFAGSSERPRTR